MSKHKAHSKKSADAQPAPASEAVEAAPQSPVEPVVQGETPAAAGEALVEPAGEAVRRLMEELEQAKDRHLRLAAEFDNFKKRAQRERMETTSRAQAELVAGILDALDDLGRVAHLSAETTSLRDLLAGVELVERKLTRALGQGGLERVGVEGEPFDPNRHEAVSTAPAPTAERDHTVQAVLQPGYRFGGALLRPARVSVFLWHEPEPASDSPPGA
jgi:molecular chaperone GrpE